MFHVTDRETGRTIFEEGFTHSPPNENWVDERLRMNRKIDGTARSQGDEWVERVGAYYFWPTLSKALRYSQQFLSPAIVQVDSTNIRVWATNSDEIETFFEEFMAGNRPLESEKGEDGIQHIIRYSGPWHEQRDDHLELWTQDAIPADKIMSVTDQNGVPLEE